jgi:hypothetical protein
MGSWKGAVTLEPTDHFIVYLADGLHYLVIHGTGKIETREINRHE